MIVKTILFGNYLPKMFNTIMIFIDWTVNLNTLININLMKAKWQTVNSKPENIYMSDFKKHQVLLTKTKLMLWNKTLNYYWKFILLCDVIEVWYFKMYIPNIVNDCIDLNRVRNDESIMYKTKWSLL